MGFTEVSVDKDETETFGLMFQLGDDMGTFIVPIDLTKPNYENTVRETERIKSSEYSDSVELVNYFLEETGKSVYLDTLSDCHPANYGLDTSSDMFYNVMENPDLFSKVVDDLLEEHKKYAH